MSQNPTRLLQRETEIRQLELTAIQSDRSVLRKSHLILKYAHESAEAFLDAFDTVRQQRGATRGATTDEEQDLLRAMLVMAAAGLDSMLKQVIRDGLGTLVEGDERVQEGLQTFVSRRIRGTPGADESTIDRRFLARILTAKSGREQVTEEYIRHLTGVSLQSVEELRRTVGALGLDPGVIGLPDQDLKTIFGARNRIIHEFDIDFAAARRNRKSRTRDLMVGYTNAILEVAESILAAADRKLVSGEGAV